MTAVLKEAFEETVCRLSTDWLSELACVLESLDFTEDQIEEPEYDYACLTCLCICLLSESKTPDEILELFMDVQEFAGNREI